LIHAPRSAQPHPHSQTEAPASAREAARSTSTAANHHDSTPQAPPAQAWPAEFEVLVDGRKLLARRGQSVAALLLGQAPLVCRQSPSGTPRAPLCGMGTCFECRVDLPGQPQVRGCLLPCSPGLRIRTAGNQSLSSPAGVGSSHA
jgi:D-hydroxyproline dehydrogenase subunit gamma